VGSPGTRQSAKQYAVGLCRSYLKLRSRSGPDELIRHLDEVIAKRYRAWTSSQLERATLHGEVADGIDPPRDIVSYLLDHALPPSLFRLPDSGSERIEELRELARELDEGGYLALLLVYADHLGDVEGVRRAWDHFTNARSPYWRMFTQFRDRSHGGVAKRVASKEIETRNIEMLREAHELRRSNMAEPKVVRKLAKKHNLTTRHVQNILKKWNSAEQSSALSAHITFCNHLQQEVISWRSCEQMPLAAPRDCPERRYGASNARANSLAGSTLYQVPEGVTRLALAAVGRV
jgi:hypothetical protein